MMKPRAKCPVCGFVTPADRVLAGELHEPWVGHPVIEPGHKGIRDWKKRGLTKAELRGLVEKLRDALEQLEARL